VSKGDTELFDINLGDVDLKQNSPKSWAMEISSAVENAFLLWLIKTNAANYAEIIRKLGTKYPILIRSGISG
jgi:hypothetical protein